MDWLLSHHDAAGFVALTTVAWALAAVSALVAARLEEREARASEAALVTRA